ncbi:MAG TPA: PilT/PilU family type 4a pilus ATPase [Sulfurovum sp.]|nr:PilT/PilU family type 4a pilus ATPase [Sulfurovum sp.]
MEEKLELYLRSMIANDGSDLHIKAGSNVRVRIDGALKILGEDIIDAESVVILAQEITTKDQYKELLEKGSLDFSYKFHSDSRFRVNIFHQMDGLSAVFRIIPANIPTIKELGLPEVIGDFADIARGLVLVTGVTGSGKSTTLASILSKINHTHNKHIITLEDPIEFVHKDIKCLINQRAMGSDFKSFDDALPAALREDPDIILVGEMRDTASVELALHAANTGHLVFSTLHTLDAKETINRIVGMFTKEEQSRIRVSLASVLAGVISQRLLKRRDGGRVAATEIMIQTSRIKELISENRDFEILDAIEEGKDIYRSQSFDQHLLELSDKRIITREVALKNATRPSDLKLKLDGVGRGGAKVLYDEAYNSENMDAFEFKSE